MSARPSASPASLACPACGGRWPIAPMFFGCPRCLEGGRHQALEVAYDWSVIRDPVGAGPGVHPTVWNDAGLLPPVDPAQRVSLGEGQTPLVRSPGLAAAAGLERAWVKHEGTNPTGAFKDRLNAVTVSLARAHGYTRVLCTSTGNHGVSLAAYAAAGRLACLVVCSAGIEPLAIRQMRLHGARVVALRGTPAEARAALARLVADEGWWPSTRNHPRPYANPFGLEGYKTIAVEIWRQLGRRLPDRVLVPTGGGDSLAGIAKGFRDLMALGLADRVPALVACQAAAAAPLVRAWAAKAPAVAPVTTRPSIAVSVAEDQTGDHALRALAGSGEAVAVEEDEIRRAVALLGRDGLCVEPASAVAAAGLVRLGATGCLRPDESVVCVATASGVRWASTFADETGPEPLEPAALTRSR